MADGLRKGLTSYGDAGFSLFLRKAFIKAMGYSDDALNRPIVGITNTHSDFNPCHGNVPQIIRVCEALPPEKQTEVADFARFLLSRQDDARWEELLDYPGPRPKLEAFLRESAAEPAEPRPRSISRSISSR